MMNITNCSFVFVLLNALILAYSKPESYSFLLTCGSSLDGEDSDGRQWKPDDKFLTLSNNSISIKSQFQDPSLPSSVPYMSTRIFTSESTYSFPVSPSTRHWLRLHFYPSPYPEFDPTNALFSVVAGGVTVLNNFSASITAKALTQAYIVREFSLSPSPDKILNITIVPSWNNNISFAFVNGIELITMPDLFKEPAPLVGFSDQSIDAQSSALQTMFRLNVGGQYIGATNDSGWSRTWYDDSPYLFGAAFGVTSETNKSDEIQYPNDKAKNFAPIDVYSTARSMGPDSKLNQNFNLTWVFEVDANFTYLVRLHFCELYQTRINQRVFNIFINNQTAQEAGDVIAWTGSKNVPVYKDFAVYVYDKPGEEELWVALHPSVDSKPEVYDAILNGLEIFKLNDSKRNLAGPNPMPSQMLIEAELKTKAGSKSSTLKREGNALGIAAAFGFVAAVCFVAYRRKKREPGEGGRTLSANWLPLYGSSHSNKTASYNSKSYGSSTLSSLAGGFCRHFSLSEIKRGTKNFNESHVIGIGGFGKVYKGVVDGTTKVAIKRSNPSSEQGVAEFRTEIEMLSKLRHRHLVSLIGFCKESDEMILVYDYMARGTLREHLYDKNLKSFLSWKQRLEICIGAAKGLHYLHTGAKYTIIHRDVKTTNILVDENWVAKVSDFGLSKTGPDLNQNHVSTVVKGSFGYLDPEYFRRQQLTEKSDVYSFGVVLFEVLCGRPALNPSLPKEQVSLADWARHCCKKANVEDIIDPHIKGSINQEGLKKFVEVAEKCVSDHGLERPPMSDVLWNLEFALQVQESLDGEVGLVVGHENSDGNKPSNARSKNGSRMDIECDGESCKLRINSSSQDLEEKDSSDVVFSQFINPQGR
ncbi:hypothetical protein Sjap_007385 [Stephania japonica]|uniref:non-specific serine/threonine protein kinase n=1 Tax=Stephania japonica TaxID=461633 RepID=A0AAP0JMI0_9MAGN